MPKGKLREILEETCQLLKLSHSLRKNEALDNIDTDLILQSLRSESKNIRVVSTALIFLMTKNKEFLLKLEKKGLLVKDEKEKRHFLSIDDRMRVELLLGGIKNKEPKYPLKTFMYSLDLKTDQITGFNLKDFKEILGKRQYHRLPDYTKYDTLIWFRSKRKRFKLKDGGKRIDFYGTRNVSLGKERSKSEIMGGRKEKKTGKSSIFQGALVINSAVKLVNFGRLQPRRYFYDRTSVKNPNRERPTKRVSSSPLKNNKGNGFLMNGKSFFQKMDFLTPQRRAKSGKVVSKFKIFRKKKMDFFAKTNKIKNSAIFIRKLNVSMRKNRVKKTNDALSIKSRIECINKSGRKPPQSAFFKKRQKISRNGIQYSIGNSHRRDNIRHRRARSRDSRRLVGYSGFRDRTKDSFEIHKYRQSYYR